MAEQKVGQVIPRKDGAKYNDPWEHIELTPEEIENALRKARSDKGLRLKELEYWERLSKPKTWPKWTTEEFGIQILKKIKLVVPDFVIDANNKHQFHLMCLYFMGDPLFEQIDGGQYSLKKGIALLGPVGCGKTTLLRAFDINPTNCFVVISCRKVAADYSLKDGGGSFAIDRYSGLKEVTPNDYWGQRHVGMAFDDLGTENVKKHMGNESNVMEEIFLNRYDNPNLRGKTHVTTNLDADDIEETYGKRFRSRAREMFNWITFDTTSKDRRK